MVPSDKLTFIYRDRKGVVSLRRVTNATPYGDDYLQCYDESRDALRTFRRDRILEILEEGDNAEERLAYHRKHSPPPLPATGESSKKKGPTATSRQRRILRKLGVPFPKRISKSEASALIEAALDGEPQLANEGKPKSRRGGCVIAIIILAAALYLLAGRVEWVHPQEEAPAQNG